MGVNKYLKVSNVLYNERDFLSFMYAANALRKGYGRFYLLINDDWCELKVTEKMTFNEACILFDEYIASNWKNVARFILGFFLKEGALDLDLLNSIRPRVEFGMFGFNVRGQEYHLPLNESYELVLVDDQYDPLQTYRKKSRGSLTGVSGLLQDLQIRLSDAQVDPSRKEAALRKLNSLAAEMRKLNLTKEKDELDLG